MQGLHYKTLPGMEPLIPKYRKKGTGAQGAPSEDDGSATSAEGDRFLRLGNMMLLRNRPRAGAGGKVLMEVTSQGDTARLRVSDSGPGIPAEFHQRALEEGALPMNTLGRLLGLQE